MSERCGELFSVENDVLLYDVTSTYFEGQAEANPQAQRGYSRDHRPDCAQVCIALVVTFDGFPLGYEVFAGNTHNSRTLQTIVAAMEARHGVLGRVWITDRGMASGENLAWLRQTGRRYIIGAPKSEVKKFASELGSQDGWSTVREGIEVKLTRYPETDETVILCRSADRRSKEQAMHNKFSLRNRQALERLSARVARSKKQEFDPAAVEPADRPYPPAKPARRCALCDHVQARRLPQQGSASASNTTPRSTNWAALSEGAYLLRSNISDWSDQQLWKAYIQLTQAEAAFRIQKDQLNLRPIWHQRQDQSPGPHPRLLSRLRTLEKPRDVATAERASETRRAPSSKSLRASSPMTSLFCRPQPTARSDCAASPNPTPLRPRFSTASASSCPNACAPPESNSPILALSA